MLCQCHQHIHQATYRVTDVNFCSYVPVSTRVDSERCGGNSDSGCHLKEDFFTWDRVKFERGLGDSSVESGNLSWAGSGKVRSALIR